MLRPPECQTVWLGTGQEGAGTLLLSTFYPQYLDSALNHVLVPSALVVKQRQPDQFGDALARAHFLTTSEVLPAMDKDHRGIRPNDDGSRLLIGRYQPLFIRADVNDGEPIDGLPKNTDVFIEATGVLKKASQIASFLNRTGQHDTVVLATHVVKADSGSVQTVVVGVNEQEFQPERGSQVVSNASCTTKAAATGMTAVIDAAGEPDYVDLYTIHGLTGSQSLFGKPGSRKDRAADSILPTTTNASAGLTVLFPEISIAGNNRSFRVPERDGSLVVVQMIYRDGLSITETVVNDGFNAHHQRYPHVLGVAPNGNFTSQDVRMRFEAGVADPSMTRIVKDVPGGTMVEVGIWYAHSRGSAAQGLYALDHALSVRNRA